MNSLNHLTFLTSSSVKVRDAMIQDGAIERLVAILYECRDPKNSNDRIMFAWKWVLALQCLVLAGTRGSEKLRKKLVDAGIIPILATILDNHFLEKKSANKTSNTHTTTTTSLATTTRTPTTSTAATTATSSSSLSTSVPSRRSDRAINTATANMDQGRVLPHINETPGFSVELDINRNAVTNVDVPSYGNIRNHLHNEQVVIHTDESNPVVITDIRGALDNATGAIIEAQDEMEKFAATPSNTLEALLQGRVLKDDELELLNIVELVKCLQKLSENGEDSDNAGKFVKENFKSLLSDYILANELNERLEVSNLLNPDLDPFNTFFGNEKMLNPLSQAVPRTFENGLIKPVADDVIWSLQLLAFISKYTYLRKPLAETYIINGLSFRNRVNIYPPPLENENEVDADMGVTGDEYMGISSDDEPCLDDDVRCFNNVKKFPNGEDLGYFNPETEQMFRLRTLAEMGDDNDKGIVSDYMEIINITDPVKKATCLERIRMNASRLKQESLGKLRMKNREIYIERQKSYSQKWRYENLWDELETPSSKSKLADKDMQAYTTLNIFPLVERFTVKSWFQEDICYWAAVVVRNANRRDERMNGKRQCANFACGKWEDHPKQFSKCRRCKRAKYCSRECQTKAWVFHKHWCVPASTPIGTASQEGAAVTTAATAATVTPILRHPDQGPNEVFVRRIQNRIFTRSPNGELIGRLLPGNLPDPNMHWELDANGEIIATPLPPQDAAAATAATASNEESEGDWRMSEDV